MNSLVLELQQLAMSSDGTIYEVLRKAFVVATKLKLDDFRAWVESELNGYKTGDVPDYRKCRTSYYVQNPYHGLQPVVMPDSELQKLLCDVRLTESAGSLESLISRQDDKGWPLTFPIPPEMEAHIRKHSDLLGMPLHRVINSNAISAALDAVRTAVLDWSLRLEAEGILGEGMTFSKAEQEKAQQDRSINIHTFQGVLGNVTGSTLHQNLAAHVQQGDRASLLNAVREVGADDEDLTALESALRQDPKPDKPESFGPAVCAWLGRMAKKAAEGGLKVAFGVATVVLSEAVSKYYGLS